MARWPRRKGWPSDEDQREAVLARQVAADQAAGRLPARIEALRQEVAGPRAGDAATWRRLARYHEAARQGERGDRGDRKGDRARSDFGRLLGHGRAALRGGGPIRRRRSGRPHARRRSTAAPDRVPDERRTARGPARPAGGARCRPAASCWPPPPATPSTSSSSPSSASSSAPMPRGWRPSAGPSAATRTTPRPCATWPRHWPASSAPRRRSSSSGARFDRTRDLDGKLAVVSRSPISRSSGTSSTACSTGSSGSRSRQAASARPRFTWRRRTPPPVTSAPPARQLEDLLAAEPRDTALLKQLSELAENEGDLAAALQYQKRLNDVAPDDHAAYRLVQLALRAGEVEVAEAVWAHITEGDQDLARVLQAVDGMMNHGKYEAVLAATGRLLRKDPGNWEVLYREGRALMQLDRLDEAAQRFRALLDLRRDDDEVSAIVTVEAAEQGSSSRPGLRGRCRSRRHARGDRHRIADRQCRDAMHGPLAVWCPASPTGRAIGWAPMDFGQARMVALGSLLAQAQRDNGEDAFLERLRQAPSDRRSLWDTFYLGVVRQEPREVTSPPGHWPTRRPRPVGRLRIHLRAGHPRQPPGSPGHRLAEDEELDNDKTPPLPPDELDLVRDAFISVVTTNPVLASPDAHRRRADRAQAGRPRRRPRPVLSRAGRQRQRSGLDHRRRLAGRRPRRFRRSVDALRSLQPDPPWHPRVGDAPGPLDHHAPGTRVVAQRISWRKPCASRPTPSSTPRSSASSTATWTSCEVPRRPPCGSKTAKAAPPSSPDSAVPLPIPPSRSRTLGHVV